MRGKSRIWLAAIGIGVANAIIFKVFEAIVNDGSNFIWNDLFASDTHRWVVVPVAVGLSIVFSLSLRWLRVPRWTNPETDLFASEKPRKTRLRDIGSILFQGAASLLAGASLGPEMSLTDSSKAIGQWLTNKTKADKATGAVLIAASIGALMIAFIGSLLLILLPLLLIYKQAKRISGDALLIISLSGFSAYGTLWLLDRKTEGYGSIPASPHAGIHDYWGAAVVALCVSVAAFALIRFIGWLAPLTRQLEKRWPWYTSAALFGLILGLLYLIGGQSDEFSGSAGSKLLLSHAASYGTWAFFGLALIKLITTAWSKTTGYRGGLFFPSIYAGVAISLFIGSLVGSLAGPGAMVGAIGGIFAALTGSAGAALLILIALLPIKLLPLAVIATVFAVIGNRLLTKYFPGKS
jgi:CIC family chloride channel protein